MNIICFATILSMRIGFQKINLNLESVGPVFMLLTILNIVIFVAFLIGLYVMARRHVSFPKRVFTALGIGIVFGIAIHLIYGVDSKVTKQTTDWFSIVGDGYISFDYRDRYRLEPRYIC